VERQVSKSAAALLLRSRIGEKFSAIVTGASEKGTWVRLSEPPVEGKLSKGYEGLEVGMRVSVKLVSTDVEKGLHRPGKSIYEKLSFSQEQTLSLLLRGQKKSLRQNRGNKHNEIRGIAVATD